ncbi:MAG: 4'-phosphopantetheinyl transferase superfamily protein [Pseudomonadota bacterium]
MENTENRNNPLWLSRLDCNYQLDDTSIDIWLCNAENMLSQSDYFFSILSANEQVRALRFKFDTHRNRFIISHGFTRCVLAKYLQVTPADIKYKKEQLGKPYLSDINKSALTFNLSHTEDISILAVAKYSQLGIDIEYKNRKTDWQAISQKFYTHSEKKSLSAIKNENHQKQAFYELWTRKEAYMKVIGTGLSLPPTGFSLSVPPASPILIKHHFKKYNIDQVIEFNELVMPATLVDYCATLASNSLKSKIKHYLFD